MKRIFVVIVALVICSLAMPATAKSKKQTYEFLSTPSGATVATSSTRSGERRECVTPCKMKLKPSGYILFGMMLDGYENMILNPDNAPKVDGVVKFNVKMLTKEEAKIELEALEEERRLARLQWQMACNIVDADKLTNNSEATPCRRFPPTMPPRAISDGWCSVSYDVTDLGEVTNVKILSCTDPVFERSTLHSVKRWQYLPARVEGKNVWTTGIEVKIAFSFDQ